MAAPALALVSGYGGKVVLEAVCGCGWKVSTHESRLKTPLHSKVKRVIDAATNHAYYARHEVKLQGLVR
jgi:hypothetical protein